MRQVAYYRLSQASVMNKETSSLINTTKQSIPQGTSYTNQPNNKRNTKKKGMYTNKHHNRLFNSIKKPNLVEMLYSICPYLPEKTQVPIHTFSGILQTLDTVKTIQSHTYRIQGLKTNTFVNEKDRQIGMIQAIKPYVAKKEKLESIEKAISSYSTMKNSISQYSQYKYDKQKKPGIQQIIDFVSSMKQFFPNGKVQQIDRLLKIVKIANTMDLTEQVMNNKDKNIVNHSVDTPNEKAFNILPDQIDASNEKIIDADIQQQKIIDTIKPLLNEEQQKSIGPLIQLAKKLSTQMNDSDTK